MKSEKIPAAVVSGACLSFEAEQKRILSYLKELELSVGIRDHCDVTSNGAALGWDFFQIFLYHPLIENVVETFPDIRKEEGITIEQQFVLWLSKQFKKRNQDYNLKLSEIPYTTTRGFRLDPNNYRDDSILTDLR